MYHYYSPNMMKSDECANHTKKDDNIVVFKAVLVSYVMGCLVFIFYCLRFP